MSATVAAASSALSGDEAGPIFQRIQSKLTTTFAPTHLVILNESYMHGGRGNETHFKVTVVSASFEGQPILARHRAVNAALAEELKSGVHALSITARTPTQWEADSNVAKSPACLGGSKHDHK